MNRQSTTESYKFISSFSSKKIALFVERFKVRLFTTPKNHNRSYKFYSNLFKEIHKQTNQLPFYAIHDFLNKSEDINVHLRKINEDLTLNKEKLVLGLVETIDDWKSKRRFLKTPIIGTLLRAFYFVFLRILPKYRWYRLLTFNRAPRLYSKAEILGRFIYNGFEIIHFESLPVGYHLFILKRIANPSKVTVSEGIILKMKRLGKNNVPFNIYKFRTMHPYSEFLHEYMIINHGFNEKGKINNDFRMAQWGMKLRKFWLDEIPQLFNLLKGDLKLVGVRPVSQTYFNTLSPEIQEKRRLHKPGCIPPYVALEVGTTKDAVLKAESIYMEDKKKNPYFTDLNYFLKAIFRIVFKGKRSS